jgi:serine/threonine-protein kinase HipA
MSNGDLHLKNLSLLTDRDGNRRLAPAYDLISTKLVLPNDGS